MNQINYIKVGIMKKRSLSLVACIAIAVSSVGAAEFDDAVINGKLSGDATVTYEMRDSKKNLDNYYNDSAYSVGSAELIYKTADFHNFNLAFGMRGYKVLWEDHKNSISGYGEGKGDASSRFWNIDGGDIAVTTNAYIGYDTDKIKFKAGRQELETEWLDEHHDAITLYAKPIDKLEVELIWSKKHYRMWSRELFYGPNMDGFSGTINSEGGGIYKLGLTYDLLDSLKVKAYALHAPSNYSVYGGKATLALESGDFKYGGFFHYMQTDEKLKQNEDGSLIDTKAYIEIDGYNFGVGYIQTGKDGGWGSAYKGGENVTPFEEGDKLYNYIAIDTRTPYITLSKTIMGLSLSAIYGQSTYKLPSSLSASNKNYKQSEFCLWAGYDITKNLNLSAILTIINEDEKDVGHASTDLTQVSSTIAYKF